MFFPCFFPPPYCRSSFLHFLSPSFLSTFSASLFLYIFPLPDPSPFFLRAWSRISQFFFSALASQRIFFSQRTMGQNQVALRHRIIHCPTSSGVSEWASEQMSALAKQAVWSKWMSELCKQTRERTHKWPSTHFSILGYSEPQCSASIKAV